MGVWEVNNVEAFHTDLILLTYVRRIRLFQLTNFREHFDPRLCIFWKDNSNEKKEDDVKVFISSNADKATESDITLCVQFY